MKEAWKFKDERRMDIATAGELQKEKPVVKTEVPKLSSVGYGR